MDKHIPLWKRILIHILFFVQNAIFFSFDVNQKLLDKCIDAIFELQEGKMPTEEEINFQLQELSKKFEEAERNYYNNNKQS